MASPLSIAVLLNTPTTVDLAPSIAGPGVTGIAIVSGPGVGTATVNGTQVTYTPRNNYFGPDSFTYVAFGTGGTSAPATVTVTVAGRPDVPQDPTVSGTINNQVQTARRFSQSQLTNYQRRMESLHRGGGASGGKTGASAQARAATAPDNSTARPQPFPDLASAYPLGDPQNNARLTPPVRVAGLAPPTDAASPATGALGSPGPGFMTQMSAATGNSINLAAVGGSSDTPGSATGSTSFWVGGDARFGTRDPSGGAGSTSFSTDGVSVGVDRRFSDKLVLGIGLGFARDKSSIGTDGTQSRATGQSGALYGSYQPSQNTFVDALLGYGTMTLDAQRFVAPASTYATSHRTGNQIFGSVAAGYEYRNQNLLVSPYGRLDFTVNKLKQTSEAGAGLYSLTYLDSADRTSRATLGIRAEASHETNWGVAKPRVRVEYLHGFQGGSAAQLTYADQLNPSYAVNTNTIDRNSIAVSVGSSLALRNGINVGIDYQIMRSFAQETSQAVRFTLSKEFDSKGYSGSLLPNFDSTQPPLGIRVDAGYMYDRNVSR
ncbi:MAG: autotransporter domain-containing protein, partial [Betaproteobacteria bacterium]